MLGLNKLKAIFRKMESGTKLKSLELNCFSNYDKKLDLSFDPSITLANAFNKLETLELCEMKLKPDQLKTIFDNMSVSTKLKAIKLERLNFDSVEMKIFDIAFSNIIKLNLNGLPLDKVKLKQLAGNLDKSCKLKTLILSDINVKEVSPRLLARVVTKVSSVDLHSVGLTVDQLEQIFQSISTGSSAIKQ